MSGARCDVFPADCREGRELLPADLRVDVSSIGWDLRSRGGAVRLPPGDSLTVQYQAGRDSANRGQVMVVRGKRAAAAGVLRQAGYNVARGALAVLRPGPRPG